MAAAQLDGSFQKTKPTDTTREEKHFLSKRRSKTIEDDLRMAVVTSTRALLSDVHPPGLIDVGDFLLRSWHLIDPLSKNGHVCDKVTARLLTLSFKCSDVSSSDAGNTKFVLDRINQAEKYLGSICVQFGKVCRKEARLRDCNDAMVQNMFEFADRERINTSLRQSLQQYASYLSAVEDYRNTMVNRIIEERFSRTFLLLR